MGKGKEVLYSNALWDNLLEFLWALLMLLHRMRKTEHSLVLRALLSAHPLGKYVASCLQWEQRAHLHFVFTNTRLVSCVCS